MIVLARGIFGDRGHRENIRKAASLQGGALADNSFTHLVVVGYSAGRAGALSGLVSFLPDDFDAPIVVAWRLDPNRESHLQELLVRKSPVEDDGSGFEGNGETRGGLGLRSIRERAALLEGTAEVYSSQKGGAGVQVCLPLRNGGGQVG